MKNEENLQIILTKLKQYLETSEGNINMEITVFKEDESIIFLLFCNKIISYYISLVFKGRICYIDKLDSTGYIKGIGKDFVKGILSFINKEIVCCFSHPKPAFIFETPDKKILNSFDLACFWIEIFKSSCEILQVCSNRFNELKQLYPDITSGYPYKSIDDLEYFKDDPKSRIRENLDIGRLDKLFEVLLCRNDFIEGSLIYGINNCISNINPVNIEPKNYSITKYLQGLDLSTRDKLINESHKFKENFKLKFVDFKYKKKEKLFKNDENSIVLIPKRRRK